jgi:hypothetical protein
MRCTTHDQIIRTGQTISARGRSFGSAPGPATACISIPRACLHLMSWDKVRRSRICRLIDKWDAMGAESDSPSGHHVRTLCIDVISPQSLSTHILDLSLFPQRLLPFQLEVDKRPGPGYVFPQSRSMVDHHIRRVSVDTDPLSGVVG